MAIGKSLEGHQIADGWDSTSPLAGFIGHGSGFRPQAQPVINAAATHMEGLMSLHLAHPPINGTQH